MKVYHSQGLGQNILHRSSTKMVDSMHWEFRIRRGQNFRYNAHLVAHTPHTPNRSSVAMLVTGWLLVAVE